MRNIYTGASALNLAFVQAALEELQDGEVPILCGHRAQQTAYVWVLNDCKTEFERRMMPVAF